MDLLRLRMDDMANCPVCGWNLQHPQGPANILFGPRGPHREREVICSPCFAWATCLIDELERKPRFYDIYRNMGRPTNSPALERPSCTADTPRYDTGD